MSQEKTNKGLHLILCIENASIRDRALALSAAVLDVGYQEFAEMKVRDASEELLGRPLWKREYDPHLNTVKWVESVGLTPDAPLWQSTDRWGNLGGALSESGVRFILDNVQANAGLPVLGWVEFSRLEA